MCKIWTRESERYTLDPIHQMPGLNSYVALPIVSDCGDGTALGLRFGKASGDLIGDKLNRTKFGLGIEGPTFPVPLLTDCRDTCSNAKAALAFPLRKVKSEIYMDVLVQLAADIVAAYVSRNSIPAAHLPHLIASVHSAIGQATADKGAPPAPEARPEPAVPIKRSITQDFIICLEDGKKFKSMKRHLGSEYRMTPEAYRKRWGLPPDYPMVAPSYSTVRSKMAKAAGLGVKSPDAPARSPLEKKAKARRA